MNAQVTVYTDLSWSGATAIAHSLTIFDGTEASTNLSLATYKGSEYTGGTSVPKGVSLLLPRVGASYEQYATWMVPGECGYYANGNATATAKTRILATGYVASTMTNSSTSSAAQPACVTNTGGSGGGSGGTVVTTCWYTDVYAADGTYLYTYTNECWTTYYADAGSGPAVNAT